MEMMDLILLLNKVTGRQGNNREDKPYIYILNNYLSALDKEILWFSVASVDGSHLLYGLDSSSKSTFNRLEDSRGEACSVGFLRRSWLVSLLLRKESRTIRYRTVEKCQEIWF
jgi:hypothetical protein